MYLDENISCYNCGYPLTTEQVSEILGLSYGKFLFEAIFNETSDFLITTTGLKYSINEIYENVYGEYPIFNPFKQYSKPQRNDETEIGLQIASKILRISEDRIIKLCKEDRLKYFCDDSSYSFSPIHIYEYLCTTEPWTEKIQRDMNIIKDEEYLTQNQAAYILGITEERINSIVKDKLIESKIIDDKYFFLPSSVHRYLNIVAKDIRYLNWEEKDVIKQLYISRSDDCGYLLFKHIKPLLDKILRVFYKEGFGYYITLYKLLTDGIETYLIEDMKPYFEEFIVENSELEKLPEYEIDDLIGLLKSFAPKQIHFTNNPYIEDYIIK